MTTIDNAHHRRRHRVAAIRAAGKRPPWMEKPKPVTQVLKFIGTGHLRRCWSIIPFWSVIATSLADQQTINDSGGGMVCGPPASPLDAYQAVLSGGVVTRALVISIGITVVGTLLSLAATAGLAYWLSRPGAYGAKPVLMLVLGAVLFSPGMIPTYLVVKQFGLLDSLLVADPAGAGQRLQRDRDAGVLPGAAPGAVRVRRDRRRRVGHRSVRIVLPLSKAVLAVVGLFYAVAYWNAFFNALLYIQPPTSGRWRWCCAPTWSTRPPSAATRSIHRGRCHPSCRCRWRSWCIAIVPILLVYPFLQRHFAKGVMIGAVKG